MDNQERGKAFAKAVENLVEFIVDYDDPEITMITIQRDTLNPDTHWVVYALVKGEDRTHHFKYAVYINDETGSTEVDGF